MRERDKGDMICGKGKRTHHTEPSAFVVVDDVAEELARCGDGYALAVSELV